LGSFRDKLAEIADQANEINDLPKDEREKKLGQRQAQETIKLLKGRMETIARDGKRQISAWRLKIFDIMDRVEPHQEWRSGVRGFIGGEYCPPDDGRDITVEQLIEYLERGDNIRTVAGIRELMRWARGADDDDSDKGQGLTVTAREYSDLLQRKAWVEIIFSW